MNQKLYLVVFLMVFSINVNAQEITNPLSVSLDQIETNAKERGFSERQDRFSRDGALELPFIDDFSRYSLPTNNPEIPIEWQMWVDNDARLNNTLPLNAPTIGVATLDGLDETGFPYDFSDEFAYGPADTLTSCPINLDGLTAADSVKLIFHYQSGGLGNEPDFQDSLVLEFLVENSDPPLWQIAWSTSGTTVSDFERVIVKVDEAFWLQPNAQFRFRNYATLSANVDHWHIDYVWLDSNIIEEDFKIIDVAAAGHESSLLSVFNNVPWSHFQSDPGSFMESDESVSFRNLDGDRNISFGADIFYDGDEQASLSQNPSTAANGFSIFERQFSIDDGDPHNYVFDESVNDTCADFLVKYYCNTTPDINQFNDTLEFNQHFGNFYAYDDGSAEGAYALNVSGSSKAVRYNNAMADSLLGLLIHFSPFAVNNSNELFLLRVWGDQDGSVGEQIEEQFNPHFPEYFMDGNDRFAYYEYDSPVAIAAGSFYVGITQSTDAEMNIGYDKHNNSNTENLFFKLGISGPWVQSSIEGALMIRPVFQSNKELEWDFVNIEESRGVSQQFNFYPNPANEYLYSNELNANQVIRIYNNLGSLVREYSSTSELYVGDLPKGIYIVHVLEGDQLLATSKLIKD